MQSVLLVSTKESRLAKAVRHLEDALYVRKVRHDLDGILIFLPGYLKITKYPLPQYGSRSLLIFNKTDFGVYSCFCAAVYTSVSASLSLLIRASTNILSQPQMQR